MTDYIRRLVSGDKARFKDAELNLELDLVYLTDQIIIMGYPANGMEGWYRNKRHDTKAFLDHRHRNNYWIFNFCPQRENKYDPQFFYGRVSRYPFPDHHAPPLALLPLVAREMRAWLSGSSDRVAVLHCKAGKGRSGTMACAYLLSLDDSPTPPKLQRSYTAKQWAQLRAENAMDVVPVDVDDNGNDDADTQSDTGVGTAADEPRKTDSPVPITPASTTSTLLPPALTTILDLHTSRRMKAPSSASKRLKQGVSIPSQRRWLYYWALLLAHSAPKLVWSSPSPVVVSTPPPPLPPQRKTVRLTSIVIRMRAKGSIGPGRRATIGIVKAASKLLEQTKAGKGGTTNTDIGEGDAKVWVSLARYKDEFVGLLEEWERRTREDDDDGDGSDKVRMGVRKPGSEHFGSGEKGEEELNKVFEGGKWDNEKMVRSFARMGVVNVDKGKGKGNEKGVVHGEQVDVYTLRPLTTRKWDTLRDEIERQEKEREPESGVVDKEKKADGNVNFVPASEANSMYDLTVPSAHLQGQQQQDVSGTETKERGVIVDAAREIRVKLYMGQVFMGWLWFIPAFHMSPPPTAAVTSNTTPKVGTEQEQEQGQGQEGPTKFRLTRKELDFPVGIGKDIVDVEIELEWVGGGGGGGGGSNEEEPVKVGKTEEGEDGQIGEGEEDEGATKKGVMGALAAAVAAGGGVRDGVEVAQAADD